MIHASGASWKLPVGDYHTNNASLQQSIKRLSSGDSFIVPGGDPAGLAISERMRAQVSNTEQAIKNIKHAQSALQTVDSWLQEVNNIVTRMGALATSSIDGSKSAEDRTNLDKEFQELKEEIARIGHDVEYNGLKVMNNTAAVTYDTTNSLVRFMQPDGTQAGSFSVTGNASNGLSFDFSATNDFVFADDNRSFLYIDANSTVSKYDIETGALTRAAAALAGGGRLVMSDAGSIYVDSNGTVAELDMADLSLTNSLVTTNLVGGNFVVRGDYAIHANAAGTAVLKSHLTNVDDVTTLYTPGAAIATTAIFSKDGSHLAEISGTAGYVTVTNIDSGESSEIHVSGDNAVTDLAFDDHGNLYGVDETIAAIVKIELQQGAETPLAIGREVIHSEDAAGDIDNLTTHGGSPISRANFQIGADYGMKLETGFADVSLADLGIGHLNVADMDSAEEALTALSTATDRVSEQRAEIGAQVSRLSFTAAGTRSYANNISQAESMIRDVDVAEETAKLAGEKMRAQLALGMISETNEMTLSLLSLLR